MQRMGWSLLAITACLFLLAIVVEPVAADHEAGHRVYISGIVTNGDGVALDGVEVTAKCPDCGVADSRLRSTETNRDGEYEVKLHVHDVDDGKTISLVAKGGSPVKESVKNVTLNLPGSTDTRSESGEEWRMEVDLELDVEARAPWFNYVVFIGGALLLLGIAYVAAVQMKKMRLAQAEEEKERPRKDSGKSKSGGKKKSSKPSTKDAGLPEGMVRCEHCSAKVKEENLERHVKKVHKK